MNEDYNPTYVRPLKRGFGLYYDPLYGYVPLSPIIRRALDLPSMQRLRHIKQLSTVYLVFPGATHSRFEHSVGVYHLADKVFDVLFMKKEHFKKENWPLLSPVHRIVLQLAAIFHDVGHGPWSHVFELFCGLKEDYRKWNHKVVTGDWIRTGIGRYKDIPFFINTESKRVERELKKIIDAESWSKLEEELEIFTPENISAIATGQPPSDKRYMFLSNIISGIFDVDRMDYLRRDAFYTGVETGSVDIWEIIHSYTLAEENGRWIAALSTEAAAAVEVLLTVRDLAYRQVYYHKTHRSAQEMMIRAMCELIGGFSLEELTQKTDEELLRAFESEKGNAFTRDIAQRIRNRAVYEPLPININISEDLDDKSQNRWTELVFGVPERRDKLIDEWLESEKNLRKKLNLSIEHSVIFDIRSVPITGRDEYDSSIFYGEATKRTHSLLELLPHLGLTRGTREIHFDGKTYKIDLTELYLKEISNLLITLPFEYINQIAKQCKEENEKGKKIEDIISAYSKNFDMIMDEFIVFLKIDKDRAAKLKTRFENGIKHYLNEIIVEMA